MKKKAPSRLPDARGLKVALLHAAFNQDVVAGLVEGARGALREMGAAEKDIDLIEVPGAFELPLAARAAAFYGRFDVVVALGAVIRGETDHYEHVAREAAAGLAAVARETMVPVGFGVLTVEKEEQATARSRPGAENKGVEAAKAAVSMVHVLRDLRGTRPAKD
jgi:6,7-dimethyl-8-ribityllumazine synthase